MGTREVLRNFVKTTSLKGIPKVINSPTIPQKLLWALGAIFGLCVGILVLYRLFASYFAYKTVVSIEEQLEGSPFPDVTICNLNPMPIDTVQSGTDISFKDFQSLIDAANNTSPMKEAEMREDYIATMRTVNGYMQSTNESQAANQPTRFVSKCHWSSSDSATIPCVLNKGFVIQRGVMDFHQCVTFQSKHQSKIQNAVYGLAVVVYLDDFADETISDVEFSVHTSQGRGVKVLIHPPDTLPMINLYGLKIPPGQESTVSIKTTERRWMEEPYGTCTRRTFLDDSETLKYTKRTCGDHLIQEHFISKCQCLSFLTMTTKEQRLKYPYCGKYYDDISRTVKNLDCFVAAMASQPRALKKSCPPPCVEYRYETEIHSVPWPHEAYQLSYYNAFINGTEHQSKFKIFEKIAQDMKNDRDKAFKKLRETDLFKRNFLQVNILAEEAELLRMVAENPALSLSSLIGTLGGACNLWMGISFLTAIELLDLLYQLCTNCKKEEEGNKDKSEETRV